MRSLIQFPRPVEVGATRFQLLREWVWESVRSAVHWLGLPGAIHECKIRDAVTGQHIRITVTRFGTELWIDGREYHFDRLTGKLRGTGMQIN